LIQTPSESSEAILTVRDTRTTPSFEQSTTIYSYQPDSIEILMPEKVIIGQSINYDIKFYHQKKLLKGSIDPSLLSVTIEDLPHTRGDKVFLLDSSNNKIQGFNKGQGVFKVSFNGLTAEKKIQCTTPLKLVSQSSRVTLPVGEIYQLQIVGGSGLYKYSLPTDENTHQDVVSVAFNGLLTARK
jgi:hypothetical protein